VCRILPPVTHHLADALPLLRDQLAPVVTRVVALLDRQVTPTEPIRLKVSRARAPSRRIRRPIPPPSLSLPPLPHCRGCGAPRRPWSEWVDAFCPDCQANHGTRITTTVRGKAAAIPITPKKRKVMSDRTNAVVAWNRANPHPPDPGVFRREIAPYLDRFTLSEVSRATGLSRRYLRLVRDGDRVPHPMHWDAFRGLLDS
jgi:hypothetical protein